MSDMTTHHNSSKVLLITDGHAVSASTHKVQLRRFKIARIRPENRPGHDPVDTRPKDDA
jgi:hypothetical protein